MSGKQRAVLWLGIILITLNLVKNWKEISSVIFTGSSTAGGSGSKSGSGSTPGIGGLGFPFNIGGIVGLTSNTPPNNTVTPV
jgi:hypothetical protein